MVEKKKKEPFEIKAELYKTYKIDAKSWIAVFVVAAASFLMTGFFRAFVAAAVAILLLRTKSGVVEQGRFKK